LYTTDSSKLSLVRAAAVVLPRRPEAGVESHVYDADIEHTGLEPAGELGPSLTPEPRRG